MNLAADFRAQARQALRGKWPMAVLAGLLATLLGGATQNGPEIKFNLDLGSGTGRASLNYVGRELASVGTDFHLQFNGWLAGAAVYLTVVALALVVLLFVVGSVVGVGYSKFNLDLVDGQEANINRLFSYFSWWKTAVAASLLQGVLILLWSLLLIIPGIVASLSYAMTDYILAENPDLTASQAIQQSKEMMQGNRWRLFCLQLSFIGWSILCLFTFGIGNLVLNPYQKAAEAAFYREVSGTGRVYDVL